MSSSRRSGRLYIRDVAGGTPRQLTAPDGDFQLFPAWSRDGSRIVFVSWNDRRLGEIRTVGADGSNMRTVSQNPGHYRRPRFSPDGGLIVYEASGGQGLTSNRWGSETGIFRIPSNGGAATRILADGGNPQFGSASDRLFLEVTEQQKRKLVSVDLGGGNRRDHAQGEMVTGYELSPDGRTLAFRENYNVFAVPFFGANRVLELSAKASQLPVVRVTTGGANYPTWAGNRLCLDDGADALQRHAGRPAARPIRAPTTGTSLAITVPADVPTGWTALVGARIVTMANEDGGIIDDAVILIEGNRIRAGRPARLGRDPRRRAHRRRRPARPSSPA